MPTYEVVMTVEYVLVVEAKDAEEAEEAARETETGAFHIGDVEYETFLRSDQLA